MHVGVYPDVLLDSAGYVIMINRSLHIMDMLLTLCICQWHIKGIIWLELCNMSCKVTSQYTLHHSSTI